MKTKHLFLTLLMSVIFISMTEAQSLSKESRKVGSFNKITVTSGIDVNYTQGREKLEVEAEKSIINKIETVVENQTLKISVKSNSNLKTRLPMTVYVSTPSLDAVSATGGSDFTAKKIKCENSFTLKGTGGSDLKINNLEANKSVEIGVTGGSDCNIEKLTTPSCGIKATGGSDLDIYFDNVNDVEVNVTGGSDARLEGVVKTVNIKASGASDVKIKGLKYDKISSEATGASDISKR